MTTEIILAGFGGQGILFAGKILAYCALMDNREISWLPSYGPEMRGGTANCSVCISDEPIGSPVVTNPDCLIAMNGPSYKKFIQAVKPNGLVLLGRMLAQTKMFSLETVQKAMEKCIPPKRAHLIAANMKAIELGMAQK